MSEQAPQIPSAKELYQQHEKDAQTVQELGELASDTFDVEGVSPGLTDTSRKLIGETVESAKRIVENNNKRASEAALAHQDIYEPQAREEMQAEGARRHPHFAASRNRHAQEAIRADERGDQLSADWHREVQKEAEDEAMLAASQVGMDNLQEIAKQDMSENINARHQAYVDTARKTEEGLPMTRNWDDEDTPRTTSDMEFIEDMKEKAKQVAEKHQDIIEPQARADMEEDFARRNEQKAA